MSHSAESVPTYDTPTGEHPDPVRLREREAAAVALGYSDGDVNHYVQPIVGLIRLRLRDGKRLTAEEMEYAVIRLMRACDAETAWLATRPTPPADPKPQPSDGPEYHTELQFWQERQTNRTHPLATRPTPPGGSDQ